MKRRIAKKYINAYKKKYKKFLSLTKCKIVIVKSRRHMGYLSTEDIKNKHIGISLPYVIANSKALLDQTIRHEIAHLLDYTVYQGWRESAKDVGYHDEIFFEFCDTTGAKHLIYGDEKYIKHPKKMKF